MSIPESQLSTWSNQGATVTAQATHTSIRAALDANTSPIKGKGFEVYLQGSYRNYTNTYGSSDVDVVVQLNSTFEPDTSRLSQPEQQRYNQTRAQATYFLRTSDKM